jgi:integrase
MEERMLGRQAKIVSPTTLQRMLAYAQRTRQPKRDAVIVLLSVKAGLRACEIAGLQWSMVMTDDGEIGDVIDIRNAIAKRGSGRRIPMHPDLQRALAELWCVRTSDNHIVASNRGGAMRANSIVNWFVAMFAELGIEGCSSHSGRRTFITAAAKNVHRAGGSLRDVQLLAGHRSIETTQRYIEGDTPSQRRLVSLL